MLIDLITAAVQFNKAKKIDATRPTYNIPQEVFSNRDMYQNAANTTRIPGQSIAENKIGAQGAGSMNAAMQAGGSSSDILSAISNINQNQNNAYNDLSMQGAQMQSQSKDKLAMANNQVAEYRDQAFDYNKNQPYELALMRKRALEGAAYGNINNASSDMHEGGMALMGAGGGGCFHPHTMIIMIDGTEKQIKDIEIGDHTLGGVVEAVQKYKKCKLLNYLGVLVTGNHAVYESYKWIRVGESEKTTYTEIESIVYNLSTSEHKIFVKDIMFSDHDELAMEDQVVINNYSLSLLNK
jgi:hypothetical protein